MNKLNPSPKAILYIRILAGGYLMYLSWGMFKERPEGPVALIPVLAFALIGLALLVVSIRQLIQANKQEAEEAARAAAEAEAARAAAEEEDDIPEEESDR